ncbi:endonuclease/exonuclease/phosphatase [Pedobacter yulinensis]|uniref:Endonuclease/exonuclease/phosphatase n=1 Tax=Pedobacter yulinensis TaxID=2126353 RepID=A0A2T3HMS0_9SPHI|nr:endonuclease/exonuclease/phosphatase family protein [Pedobacter yulinensis]PST83693.1 endonuclease/exonuclease/phosphatase [Pedobacter yulinensis]
MKYFLTALAALFFCSIAFAQLPDNLPLKLRVGTYNVGHFNQGSLGGFQRTGQQVTAEMLRWKKWIGEQSLDILALNEWNKHFDKDSTLNAEEVLLKPYYRNVYFGAEKRWIYNGIATHYKLQNIRQKVSSGEYYMVIGDLKVGRKNIAVISVHIPWQKDWHKQALEALTKELEKHAYFICMGDMNSTDAEQLAFRSKGFNIANGGHMGWFGTAAAANMIAGRTAGPNTNIDNIITSGNISIMKVSAPHTGLNDLDHLPVMADLVVNW